MHILRFLLLALLSARTRKPQWIGSHTQSKRTNFTVSRDLESQNTWAIQPERMERTATPNPVVCICYFGEFWCFFVVWLWVFCLVGCFFCCCGGVFWFFFGWVFFSLHYWKKGKRTRFFLAAVFCPSQIVCCSLLLYLSKLTVLVFSFPFYQAGGFIDMFGMMNDMIGNMVRTLHKPLCSEGEALRVLLPSPLMSPVFLCCFSTGCVPCFMTRIQR